ncbi:hypothetical protein [Capnocytophaga sp.]|uniref:hypothetical protein n=1 Tax=Capnocytophaga sp. TaxID=44737 RepID=UPI0026DA91FA|nr:hypothetical protein [Capnocytophaga sp.]MDO5104455.1 hypothetical protein [Capnocytophaga sp.]
MKNIETLKKLFDKAQSDYPTIKKNIENQIVRWFWTNGQWFELEPFYFEKHSYVTRGEILPQKPDDFQDSLWQYGVNSKNEIIVEREMTETENDYYETFYIHSDNQILCYRFDCENSKKIYSVKLFLYENSLLKNSYAVFESGVFCQDILLYENQKLVAKKTESEMLHGEKFNQHETYSYDENGQLQSIKEGNFVWYERPCEKSLRSKLTAQLHEKITPLIKQTIENQAPKELLYCINLSYRSNDLLPPLVGFGTQADREKWLKNKFHHDITWDVAHYTHFSEIQLNEEVTDLLRLFHQETNQSVKFLSAIQIISECVKSLKVDLQDFSIKKTDDFVVGMSCFGAS